MAKKRVPFDQLVLALIVAACGGVSQRRDDAPSSIGGQGGASGAGQAGATSAGGSDSSATEPIPATLDRALLAQRLAHLIWAEAPDQALVALVNALDPADSATVAELARDMLSDARAAAGIAAFYRQWLGLDTLALEPKADGYTLSPDLAADMVREVDELTTELTLNRAAFRGLFFSERTFVNDRLAQHYGLSGAFDASFQEIPLDGTTRLGLFTSAAVLTHFSSSTQPSWPAARGLFITEKLLCTTLPEPPLGASVYPPPTKPVRDAAEMASSGPACHACHVMMDPVGYPFIPYDTLGRWDPAGESPDFSGFVAALPDQPVFSDLTELFELLASRDEPARCFTRHWLTRALDVSDQGLGLVNSEDVSVDQAASGFASSGYDLEELIVELTKTPAFLSP
jgi:hypothetical protein